MVGLELDRAARKKLFKRNLHGERLNFCARIAMEEVDFKIYSPIARYSSDGSIRLSIKNEEKVSVWRCILTVKPARYDWPISYFPVRFDYSDRRRTLCRHRYRSSVHLTKFYNALRDCDPSSTNINAASIPVYDPDYAAPRGSSRLGYFGAPIDLNCRFAITQDERSLFPLFRQLMIDEVCANGSGAETYPARESSKPISKTMFFGLRPWDPCRGGRMAKLIELSVQYEAGKYRPEQRIREKPTKPIAAVIIAWSHLVPFVMQSEMSWRVPSFYN